MKTDSYMWPTAVRTHSASEGQRSAKCTVLLVYLVNSQPFSVVPPTSPHRPISAFVTGFIS